MELVVVMGLSALILVTSYSVYVVSIKGYRENTASAELTQNARISLERMSREIRQAAEIITVLPTDPTQGQPPSQIKFQDGHDLTDGPIQYLTYYLVGTDLHRKASHFAFASDLNTWVLYSALDGNGNPPTEYTDSDNVKAQDISQLQFWGDKVITISLTVSNGTQSYQFQTQALGRNLQ